MKHLSPGLFLFLLLTATGLAQIKTEEKRYTKDSTGATIITETTIISKAVDITPRKNILVINPLKFFYMYNMTYLRPVTPVAVVGIGLGTPSLGGLNGWGVNAEVRLHPSARAPQGFYLAPNIGYTVLTSETERFIYDPVRQEWGYRTETVSFKPFSFGILAGWQWFPGDDFAIGLGIGIDYYSGEGVFDIFDRIQGTIPALRFDIGYFW